MLSEPDELPISSGAFADFEKLAGREDRSQVFAVKSFRVSLDNRGLVKKVNIVCTARSFPQIRSLPTLPSSRNSARRPWFLSERITPMSCRLKKWPRSPVPHPLDVGPENFPYDFHPHPHP